MWSKVTIVICSLNSVNETSSVPKHSGYNFFVGECLNFTDLSGDPLHSTVCTTFSSQHFDIAFISYHDLVEEFFLFLPFHVISPLQKGVHCCKKSRVVLIYRDMWLSVNVFGSHRAQSLLLLSFTVTCHMELTILEIWRKSADSSEIVNICLLWIIFTFFNSCSVSADFLSLLSLSLMSDHLFINLVLFLYTATFHKIVVNIAHPVISFGYFIPFSEKNLNYGVQSIFGRHFG